MSGRFGSLTSIRSSGTAMRQRRRRVVARSVTKVGWAMVGEAMVGWAMISLSVPKIPAGQARVGRHVVVFVQQTGPGEVLAVESRGL